jgi:archaellin
MTYCKRMVVVAALAAIGVSACGASSGGGSAGGTQGTATTSCQVEQAAINGAPYTAPSYEYTPEPVTNEKVTITNNGSSPMNVASAAVSYTDSDGQPAGGGQLGFTDSDGNPVVYLAPGHTISKTLKDNSADITSCAVSLTSS